MMTHRRMCRTTKEENAGADLAFFLMLRGTEDGASGMQSTRRGTRPTTGRGLGGFRLNFVSI